MSDLTNFRKKIQKLCEMNNFRSGFGNQIPQMPVVGMDYDEGPIEPPEGGPEETLENNENKELINIINDIIVAAQNNPEVQTLANKAKEFITSDDSEIEINDFENNEEESTVDMDQFTGAGPDYVGGAQGMAEAEQVDQEPIDPNRPIETSGETLPFGTERSDVNYEVKDDNISEIASLLVTIGHILQSERLIPNKFDIPMIIKFINHNFQNSSPEQIQTMYESKNS